MSVSQSKDIKISQMVQIFFIIFAVLAIFFTVVLVVLLCAGWFGLNGKIRQIANKFLVRSHDQEYRSSTQDHNALNTQCYICLQRIKCGVVASCNHGYCAACILRFIETKRNEQIKCPACREKIVTLFRKFQPTNEEQRQLKDKIADYNFRNKQQPGIIRSIRQLPNIIRNAPSLLTPQGIRFLMSNPRVKVILIMLIYTLSPIDLIPESLLGPFGLFDDAFVSVNILREVAGLMINFNQQQSSRNRRRDQQSQRLRA